MLVQNITISRAVKVNIGNYESTDIFVSMTAQLDDFDDPKESAIKLKDAVLDDILNQLIVLYKERGKTTTKASLKRQYGL